MKYSIVVGSTGGIGKEFTFRLLEKGENLILVARNEDKLNLLKSEISERFLNASVLCFSCDLVDTSSIISTFSKIESLSVEIVGLYFVAGVDTQKAFYKYSYDKIVMQARVNFESSLLFTKFVLKNKVEKNNLKILVVSSLCGVTPMPYFSEYSAVKSALISFYSSLRLELKGKNVKITVLAPGSVPTREDVVLDIKRQGLQGKLSAKPKSFVAQKALKALDKNKRICVPGFYNKMVFLFSKITPNPIKMRIIAKKFKNKEKDAF